MKSKKYIKIVLKKKKEGEVKMKFNKGDMVLYLPTSGPSVGGDSVMYFMNYDEKKKKI